MHQNTKYLLLNPLFHTAPFVVEAQGTEPTFLIRRAAYKGKSYSFFVISSLANPSVRAGVQY